MTGPTRADGRGADALREVSIQTGFQRNPEGSVLYSCGGTKLLLSASVDEGVRDFMRGKGQGWITAEYAMHPRCSPRRQNRDGRRGRGIDGRSTEIQRLIGRALRAAVRRDRLGERTVTVDCDVLEADGGTRTAAVTGGFIALALALHNLRLKGLIKPGVLREAVAAVSVGVVQGRRLADLCYIEDSQAQFDLNVVAGESGTLIELQGTAEDAPLPRTEIDALTDLALGGVSQLAILQRSALRDAGVELDSLLA